MGAGDWEEHAVLLCNYLLWLEANSAASGLSHRLPSLGAATSPRQGPQSESAWRSYIVLGRAIPEGNSVWVLRLHAVDDEALLINACTVRTRTLRL